MLVFSSTFNGTNRPLLAFVKNKEQYLNKKRNEIFLRPCFNIQRYVFLLTSGYIEDIFFYKVARRYRKIPKISPSKYKPPGGLYLENCPRIQSKTEQKQ